jgi:hypothetical protein
MLRWVAPILVLGLLLTVTAARAEAAPVAVEVSTASGARLGRLVGEWQGSATYFPLLDVARLASASTRRAPGGDRISLVTRHGVVQLAKDARQISVDGRAVSLAAPVRVRQGAWRVPGDLLVRGLPTLLGAGVRVTPTEIREARPVPPGLAKPSARPPVASAPRAVAVPALAPPRRPRWPLRSRSSRRGPSPRVHAPRCVPRAALPRAWSCGSARTLPTRGWSSRPTPRSSRGSSRPRPA